MSRSKLRPRPDLVGELTGGLTLPLPAVSQLVMRVIAETLVRAWNDLLTRHAETLRTGDETEVSALLITRLNALRDEEPCWENLASGVSRGGESINFDGCHLEKRPDLSIHLTNRNFSFPLVAECKLIDKVGKKTVKLYCTDGLTRFIHGDYAWATCEAFMLAYVRDGNGIEDCLVPYLTANHRKSPDPCQTERLPTCSNPAQANLVSSRHSRRFAYVHSDTASPGPIDLWHLWLPVT